MFGFSRLYIGLIGAGMIATLAASGGGYVMYHTMKFRLTQKETIILELHNTIKEMTTQAKAKQDEFNEQLRAAREVSGPVDLPDNQSVSVSDKYRNSRHCRDC